MKRFLTFITALIALFVSLVNPSDAPLSALAIETTKETIYNSSFFDRNFDSLTEIRDFPTASFYKPLENDENETNKLNYALTSTQVTRIGGFGSKDHPITDRPSRSVEIPGVNVEASQDIIYTFVDQITDPVFEQNSTKDLTFINVDGVNYKDAYDSVVENYNVALYYQQAKPSVYFNKFIGKEISFYLEPNFSGRALKDLISQYELTGTLIFLQIDNEPLLKLEIENNDFQIVAGEGVSIAFENYVVAAVPASLRFPLLRVTIPYRSSISNIVGLRMAVVEESSNIATYTLPETMIFAFHEDMATNTFFYFFNVKSLSIANKTLAIEKTSYTDFRLTSSNIIDKSKMSASLVSMQLYFSGSIRLKEGDQTIGDAYKSTQLSSSGAKIFIISMPETKTYNATFTRQSETSGNWLYTLDEEIPMTSSGQMRIYSITFHPIVDGTVREDLTFTQDYTKTELFKYSFDLKKAARIYYYNWASYYCMFTRNENLSTAEQIVSVIPLTAPGFWAYKGISNLIKNSRQNWQTFAFSFYFDDDKTEPIPDVKKITLKWQCGFERANPEPDSDGFYSGFQNNENKKVHIATKEVNNNRLPNGTYALDEDGMFLSDKDSCHKAYTANKKYDYAVAKLHKRGDKTFNSYISQMSPLEISYETTECELVRMVGNSKGLHIVQDDDGNDIVVNSEGIAPTDGIYGIFVASDGTKLPGVDKNGDGKITADEVINSDTGEGANYADPNDQSFLNKVEDFFKNLLDQIKDAVKKPRTWLWTILIILVVGTIALAILKPSTLISIFNSIKKSIQSLFSKFKNKKTKKKTSSSKKVKKKSIKSTRKKR